VVGRWWRLRVSGGGVGAGWAAWGGGGWWRVGEVCWTHGGVWGGVMSGVGVGQLALVGKTARLKKRHVFLGKRSQCRDEKKSEEW